LHGPLKKNNKNSGKFGPPPPGGRFLGFFWKILEGGQLEFGNFTGVFFSQKKEILAPQKFWRPPIAPVGAVFRFLKKNIENFNIFPIFPKLQI
jgi:hypothetical protein